MYFLGNRFLFLTVVRSQESIAKEVHLSSVIVSRNQFYVSADKEEFEGCYSTSKCRFGPLKTGLFTCFYIFYANLYLPNEANKIAFSSKEKLKRREVIQLKSSCILFKRWVTFSVDEFLFFSSSAFFLLFFAGRTNVIIIQMELQVILSGNSHRKNLAVKWR